jgi:hypothetical protein
MTHEVGVIMGHTDWQDIWLECHWLIEAQQSQIILKCPGIKLRM